MKKRLLIAGLIISALVLVACSGARSEAAQAPMPGAFPSEPDAVFAERAVDEGYIMEEAESFAMEEPALAPAMDGGVGGAVSNGTNIDVAQAVDTGVEQQERLIIRNGNLTLIVEDTRATQDEIEQMVKELAGEGAFIVSRNEYSSGNERMPYIEMQIRVPATQFDTVMDRMAEMAVEVSNRNESGQDVTEEYVDLQARLGSLEAARERLQEIMENAQTTEDLLQAEQQLTQREAEIESIKGRMQYLSESARLSSIYISLQPYVLSQPSDNTWRPAETFRLALRDFVRSLRNFGDFAIRSSIVCLPWILVFGAIIYGIVRLVLWRVRIRREKKAASAIPPEDEEA